MSAVTEFISPLPLDECCRRLRERMDSPTQRFGDRAVVGRIRGTRLRARKNIFYRNSFQAHLTADLSEQAGRTIIRCRVGMHPVVTAFVVVWLGIVLSVVGGVALVPPIADGRSHSLGDQVAALIPVGMLAFAILLVGVGRFLARGERAFLLAFVRNAVDAAPAGPEPVR